MSIRVSADELAEVAADYGATAYVITTGADGRPRITHCTVAIADGRVRTRLGRTASADVAARPAVSLLWPATNDQSMSLIADGTAEVSGTSGSDSPDSPGSDSPGSDSEVVVTVSGAVRHRAAPPLDL